MLDASASYGEDGGLSVFIVNRSQTAAVDVEISLSDVEVVSVTRADSLSGTDPKAVNSWESPNVIKPVSLPAQRTESGGVSVRVPSLGFVAIHAQTKKR